jgi:hypothetical protein
MTDYTIYCGAQRVAQVLGGTEDAALRDAIHYASQYRKDGRVTIKKGSELVAIFSQIHAHDALPNGDSND